MIADQLEQLLTLERQRVSQANQAQRLATNYIADLVCGRDHGDDHVDKIDQWLNGRGVYRTLTAAELIGQLAGDVLDEVEPTKPF
jgi:hypothetical protein